MPAVARRYFFDAEHCVENAPHPWCERHGHSYTVEVVCRGPVVDGMIVDTDELDRLWRREWHGKCDRRYLNDSVGGHTTVEDLSARIYASFVERFPQTESVTVWEDSDRWGQAP